jgi:hypothetical protein
MRVETINPVSPVGAGSTDQAQTPGGRAPEKSRPHPQLTPVSAPAAPEIPQHSLSFQLDERRRVIYQVIDTQTGEVVREIPPEEVRRAGRQIEELLGRLEAAARHVDVKS